MLFDEQFNNVRAKQMLAAKYRRLASMSNSRPRRAVLARRANSYQRQAFSAVSQIKLVTFAKKVNQLLVPRIRMSVLPIVREHWNAMEAGGTGNLFRIGEARFLVTAAHVIRGAVENGIGMYVPRFQSGELVQINGESASEQTLDIAALWLTEDVAAQLHGYTFLTMADTDCRPVPLPQGLYCSYGYPTIGAFANVVEAKIRMAGFPIHARLLEGKSSFPRSSSEYLWLHAYLNDHDLNGISGSAIWRSISDVGSVANWTPQHGTVVAIETGTYERHTVIEGTRIRHVFRMIAQRWPELATLIQDHLAL